MKKLISFLLLIGTVLSCSNPLDSVYNEPTFNNDIKLIKDVNEEDSDRIIDQVKYADEIKPGTTYREILDEYHLRRNLLIKILEFYEQESSKERFDFREYIQINIDSEKAAKTYFLNKYHKYNSFITIKNIWNKKIKLGIVWYREGKQLNNYPFENLNPNDSISFGRLLNPRISFPEDANLQIDDSIFYDNYAYEYIGKQQFHLYSEVIAEDNIQYYEGKIDSINKFYPNVKTDDDFKLNKDLTFEDVLAGYENEKIRIYQQAKEFLQFGESILLDWKKNNALEEARRKKRELADAEARRKKRALMKIKNQDREDFITVLKQYSVDNFNTKDALRKYDKEINDFNVLWDDKARMIMKNKTEIGSGQFKSLRVSFQVIVGGKEKTTLFSITVPHK